MGKNITWLLILIVILLLAGGLSFTVSLYFDWLWFQELNKVVLFTTAIYAKALVFTVTLAVVFLFLYLNLLLASRGPGSIEIGIPTVDGGVTPYRFSQELVTRVIGILSLLLALIIAARAADRWELIWRWIYRVDFGAREPVFGRDISFYFFSLPLIEGVVRLGLIVCVVAIAGVLALGFFKGLFRAQRLVRMGKRGQTGLHVSLLVAFLFVLLSASAYLNRFALLLSSHDLLYGANYVDLHARRPFLTMLMVCALVAAVLWIYNAFSSTNRPAYLAVAVYFAVFLGGSIYPALLQKFVVSPNELSRETPQIEHNISATLRAYALDNVADRELLVDKPLTPQDIRANSATIRSIRLWDHEPLLDAFSQIQEIRTYYRFTSVDNDRYELDRVPQQMMLSPRELDSASLPERNWINEHLTYSHGYGLTLGPVNRVTAEGLPVLLVQDIPPRAVNPKFAIQRPEIYFGELTREYVAVKTGTKEFDYPSGEENVYTSYAGAGGIPVESFFRKLLFALYFRDFNVVLSPLLKPDSRFLFFRDIRTRIGRLVPFLQLDQDPYMVISQGRLYWIQDAYTTGDRYPYSTPTRGIGNYIRNSVKVVVDAYNGSVDLYVADPNDPVIRVYERIFPAVFRPISEMPSDLRAHVRYPEDIFRLQTFVYSIYHMTNPQVFYNREDQWEIPAIGSAEGTRTMAPYYIIMKLPQGKQEEFILMLPFTPRGKDNLSAWIVARSDGEHYGEMVVYRFPKQKLVYGPRQIIARINQDPEISRQLSLWDQRGSQVLHGTLLVIPIEESLVYVRPLYLRAESGKIPELKRVIVAYENKIAMEETLEASIDRIFQGEVLAPTETPAPTAGAPVTAGTGRAAAVPDLLLEAKDAYDRAVQAQRQGDWARYGEELKRLGTILDQLQKKK
jgi:uncharacterized membrane protein (UPF0182 family)